MIDSVAKLEAVTGRTPPAMHLKLIDHLDEGAWRWLAQSPLMFVSLGDGPDLKRRSIIATIDGGAQGFVSVDARRLRVLLASLDDANAARVGASFGSLFLIPGIREALRINGRVDAVDADHRHVVVEECYGHCAKAIIRCDLWTAQPCGAPEKWAAIFAPCARHRSLLRVTPGQTVWGTP